MAADSHGGDPDREPIRISPETRRRLRGWGEEEMHDDEVLEELLDRVELHADTETWPTGDYY